jgi:hypothetical protein
VVCGNWSEDLSQGKIQAGPKNVVRMIIKLIKGVAKVLQKPTIVPVRWDRRR